MTGVEALIRRRHPELGLLRPDKFISLAEETGLIIPIGYWTIRRVCERSRGWTERGAAPDRLIASGASMPGVTRPLCPYPKYARYIGGNPKSAASFACR